MTAPLRLLIADDEPSVRHSLGRLMKQRGHEVEVAADGQQACQLLGDQEFDWIITDLKMPGADGMEVLRTAQDRAPQTTVIMMTAYGSVESAVEAMRLGARHFLEKPISADALDELLRGGDAPVNIGVPAAQAADVPGGAGHDDELAAGGGFWAAMAAREEADDLEETVDPAGPPAGHPTETEADDLRFAEAGFAEAGFAEADQPRAAAPVGKKAAPVPPDPVGMTRGMVGADPSMFEVFELVDRVAASDATVLITGESGTGKELIARAIHDASDRRGGLLVPVNCAAIPEGLLESELFGHVKGAFTGAIRSRTGRFALADGGTLFLDEIGEMSLPLQAKLLRVLQERIVEPVGATQPQAVDVRVLAATNRELEDMVAEGQFREDLYYRLSVIPIGLPPLRRRRSDVPLLLRHFLQAFSSRGGRRPLVLADDALTLLARYDWPGNVRELENLAERLVVLVRADEAVAADIPSKFQQPRGLDLQDVWGGGGPALPDSGVDLKEFLKGIETSLIDQALQRTGGNRNQAASLLALNRTTLVEKLRKRGL